MHPIPFRGALRASACAIVLATLAACGGGGGDDTPPLVATSTGNPSSSSTQIVAATPNATQLVAVAFNAGTVVSGTTPYNPTIGGTAYPFTLNGGTLGGLSTGFVGTNYGFIALCKDNAVKTVFSSPQATITATTPVAPTMLASKAFERVNQDNCDDNDISTDPTGALVFNADGTATRTDGAYVRTLSKADLERYFSTAGWLDGPNTYRGHAYQQAYTSGPPAYFVIETYRKDGVDGVVMYHE